MQILDIRTLPLSGLNLIEASAGTGKTWTIASLYLRLLLERQLEVEQILVLTFTKAATAELRDRIRARIGEFRAVLAGQPTSDAFLSWLATSLPNPAEAKVRLDKARQVMDQASIFTIHGFCQRALLELQVPAVLQDPTVIADDSTLLPPLLAEAWVKHSNNPTVAALVRSANLTLDDIAEDIYSHLNKPYALIKQASVASAGLLESRWHALTMLWSDAKADILEDIQGADGLSRADKGYKWLDDFLAKLDRAMGGTSTQVDDDLRKLTPDQFAATAKKKGRLPLHPFWQRLAELWLSADAVIARFRQQVADSTLAALGEKKREGNLISFQDQLTLLREAIRDPEVAIAMAHNFPVAMIDEFQDTDPLQFAIFQEIYRHPDTAAFLVGDPKQAIYGFRGADIFTYLQARGLASGTFTLGENRRSQALLVTAVNAIFAQHEQAFALPDLAFHPVVAAATLPEFFAADTLPPLQCLLLPDENGKPLGKERAGERCIEDTANTIASLLHGARQGEFLIGSKPLQHQDIAVLVNTHDQAARIQQALAERGVAAVITRRESVFASREALAMLRTLMAIIEPGNERRVRTALATELAGVDLTALRALQTDDAAWASAVEPFLIWREQWHERGFMVMWESLIEHFQVFQRPWSRMVDADRHLTNLRQLASLMQQKADTEPAPARQLEWLRQQILQPEQNDEALLRLESDAARVQIMTVHASKGLEFPVVFCPFVWDGAVLRRNEETRVQSHDGRQTVLDLGSPEQAAGLARMRRERLAEKIRLLYVALTRAKYRCYLSFGSVRDMETSALAWLLFGRGLLPDPEALKENLKGLTRDAVIAAFAGLPADAVAVVMPTQEIQVCPPLPPEVTTLELLFPQRIVRRSWSVGSFSGLTAMKQDTETPDHDSAPGTASASAEDIVPEGIHVFPRGADAGVFWHTLLEWELAGDPVNAVMIADTLARFHLDVTWQPLVAEHLAVVLKQPLAGDGMALNRLDAAIVEMEFTYPVGQLSVARLRSALIGHTLPEPFQRAIQKLGFMPLAGYLKGFIDLVCRYQGRYYVIDYKTNWLGADASAYNSDTLCEAVASHHYYLQYWLYVLAVHRLLKVRLPDYDYEMHMGGVYYLFLRGMTGQEGAGVFFDRPSLALISALDALMEGTAHG